MLVDLARLFVGAAVLSFASYTDWRWRRAPNLLWVLLALAGVVLLAVQFLHDPGSVRSRSPYLALAPLFAGLIYLLWRLGLLAGGADAKALMALALLLPFPLHLGGALPVLPSPLPGAFVVLADSLLGVLVLPVAFLLRNLLRRDLRFPAMLVGYPMALERIPDAWVWPMEVPDEDGELRIHVLPSRAPAMTIGDLEALGERGVERLWVTPKVPFMIPLTVGFVLAFTMGDVLFWAVGAVLG